MPTHGITIPEYTHYSELQGNHKAFVDRYLETGDSFRAAQLAGYKDSKQYPLKQKASKLRRELSHIIDARVQDYAKSVDMALLGLNVIKELAHNADSEQVRLKAATEIVNRCISPETKKTEITHKVQISKMTDDDLDKRIEQLREELYGKDVTPKQNSDHKRIGGASTREEAA